MAAQPKVELLLELKNRLKTGITKAKESLNSGVREMKSKLNDMKTSHVKAFSAMKDEIPGFARAVDLIRNPYVLATAAAIGFFAIAGQATSKAAAFENAFLNIKQLNLDKSKAELTDYNQLIRDTAFTVGTDLVKTTNAFYDIQSATGLAGESAAKFFTQVGNFSIATGADLNDSINATSKAMKVFGFDVDGVSTYLESNAKTVQLGITTFKELAQVQTEYGGAAASAGQGIDSANKLFAVFTSIAKDSTTAATKTKTAFEGLTAKSTIDGFKKYGVAMFDNNGQLLSTEKIVENLIPKISKMNDIKFSKFKNEIGGPEGLKDLLGLLKADGEGVLKTFRDFDNVKFDIGTALENAKGDFTVLKDIVGNRFNVVMAELGMLILPTVARMMNTVGNAIVFVREHADTFISVIKSLLIVSGMWVTGMIVAKIATLGFAGTLGLVTTGFHALKLAILSIPIVGWILAAVAALVIMYNEWDEFRAVVDGTFEAVKSFFKTTVEMALGLKDILYGITFLDPQALKDGINQVKQAFKNSDIGLSFKTGYDNSLLESKKRREENGGLDPNGDPLDPSNDGGSGDGVSSSKNGASVVGDAQQIRNITVNIEALHKGDNNIHSQAMTGGSFSIQEFEKYMNEMALRFIRNIETTAG